jgi:hypothetical protein
MAVLLREPITELGLTSCFIFFVFDVLGLRYSDVILVLQAFQFTIMISDTLNSCASSICTQCRSLFYTVFGFYSMKV